MIKIMLKSTYTDMVDNMKSLEKENIKNNNLAETRREFCTRLVNENFELNNELEKANRQIDALIKENKKLNKLLNPKMEKKTTKKVIKKEGK